MCFSALYCHSLRGFGCSRFVLAVSVPRNILDPSTYGFGNAPVSSGKLCAGVAKIWLFGCPNFLLLLYLLHREVLCCFSIRTEEIQLTAVKNFQVSKALVVAAEKIPLNVPNHRLRLEVCVCLAVD